MTSYSRPEGDPHDWAAVSRWVDAGKPDIDPDDGTWIESPALAASEEPAMSTEDRQPPPNPRQMSQAELNDYLDHLVAQGKDDTPEFHRAYILWERNQ